MHARAHVISFVEEERLGVNPERSFGDDDVTQEAHG